MNKGYRIISLVFACMAMSISQAWGDDSIPEINLQELEVRGERSWISEDGTINIIPSRKEKRLSNSPASLIESMHIPLLKTNGETIETVSGEPVTIFINGQRAEEIDLASFWTSDVKTVQYMEIPKMSEFEGTRNVVNFIVKKYAAGGVCRTDVCQKIPNYGNYGSSAKLTYKKMTFGAMFKGIYWREHRASSTGETTYSDLFYDGIHYDEITAIENSRRYERRDIINCAFNARYSTPDFYATHTLSLAWVRDPGSGAVSSDLWTNNLFGYGLSTSETRSRALSPQISGNYYKQFTDKWHLAWRWGYINNVSHINSDSKTGDAAQILNGYRETINSVSLNATPTFYLSSKLYFQMPLNSKLSWFSTDYSGSADVVQTQRRSKSSASILVGWNPINAIWLTLRPGIGITTWNIGDIREHSLYPTGYADLYWRASRKLSLRGGLRFSASAPSASESNPVRVRTSELIWTEGNPDLKHKLAWDATFNASYIFSDNLSLSFVAGYDKTINNILSIYTPAPQELEGLIMHYTNSNNTEGLRAMLPISWSCLNRNLSFQISPYWRYDHIMTESETSHHNFFKLSASADYTIGNCRFGLSYERPNKGISHGGMEKYWSQDRCDLSFTYGTDNLYLNVKVENLFHDKAKSWSHATYGNLMSRQDLRATGRRLAVTLTYTFGFGRKVDRGIEIAAPQSIESSITNSKTN